MWHWRKMALELVKRLNELEVSVKLGLAQRVPGIQIS